MVRRELGKKRQEFSLWGTKEDNVSRRVVITVKHYNEQSKDKKVNHVTKQVVHIW